MDEKVKEIEDDLVKDEAYIKDNPGCFFDGQIMINERRYLLSLLFEKEKKIEELEKTSKGLCNKIDWYCKRIKSLEEGIEKHKNTPNETICDLPPNVRILAKLDADLELYKLLEEEENESTNISL